MCCGNRQRRGLGGPFYKPIGQGLLLSAVAQLIESRVPSRQIAWRPSAEAGTFSSTVPRKPAPPTTMTRMLTKEQEATQESAQTKAAATPQPQGPPPSYQDVISEASEGSVMTPATSTTTTNNTTRRGRPNNDDVEDDDSDDDIRAYRELSNNIPGDHKQQLDAQEPQVLVGTLSPTTQTKVETLLSTLEAYRSNSSRKRPVKRARRDLLNHLYDHQVATQERTMGSRLTSREGSALWKDLKRGLRTDLKLMMREAKQTRKQIRRGGEY